MMEEDVVARGDGHVDLPEDSFTATTTDSDSESDPESESESVVVAVRESTNFTAEAVNSSLRLILSFYSIELNEVVANKKLTCIIADSASVNRRSARLLKVPFVNCLIHAFNLAAKTLTNKDHARYDRNLEAVIEEANRLAKHFRSLKCGAVLRSLTQKRPVLACPTRWSGNAQSVCRYDELRPFYLRALRHEDCNEIEMRQGEEWDFIVKSKKKMLLTIDENMRAIQTKDLKLASVQRTFDTILEKKRQWKNVTLENSYLDLTNCIYECRHFMRGVIKIQNQAFQTLSKEEREAVSCLEKKMPFVENENDSIDNDEEKDISMLDLVNEDFSRRDYINADFILAGAVDVERLWSKVGSLLVHNRMGMSSSMMQTIMILKENRSMWGSTDVFGAIERVRRRDAELHVARCS